MATLPNLPGRRPSRSAALLFQNGTKDDAVPPADALRYQAAGSEPKTTLWYDAGHGLTRKAGQDELTWLEEALGLSGDS